MKEIELKADLKNFDLFMEFINSQLMDSEIDDYDKNKVMTVCDEIIVNVIHYAYKNGEGNLQIIFNSNPQRIVFTFVDSGEEFNPLEKPDTDTTLSLDEREVGGLGIFMIKQLMDIVQYEYKENKNHLTIVKYKPSKFTNKEL